MTLREALDVALAAYDEDEGEREAILAALVPVLLDDHIRLGAAIRRAWQDGPAAQDQIREALAAYQAERAEIDAEIASVPVCPCCDAGSEALTDDVISEDALCEECAAHQRATGEDAQP